MQCCGQLAFALLVGACVVPARSKLYAQNLLQTPMFAGCMGNKELLFGQRVSHLTVNIQACKLEHSSGWLGAGNFN